MMPGKVSDFWGFKPPILAVVPATLPLSYALKPKHLARRVFDIQVSFPFSDVETTEREGGRTAHFNPEVHPNLLADSKFITSKDWK
jgi:hypothetical protein